MDILLQATDPALMTFELDVGWVAAEGRAPWSCCRVKIKDIKATSRPNFAFRQDAAEVGARPDWPRLRPAVGEAQLRVSEPPAGLGPRRQPTARLAVAPRSWLDSMLPAATTASRRSTISPFRMLPRARVTSTWLRTSRPLHTGAATTVTPAM